MGGFLIFIAVLVVVILGMLTLIFRLMAASEAKELRKDPLRPAVEVRFRPKAFLVLAAAIGAGGLFMVLAVVLGKDHDVPSYVFGVGLVILISVLKPILGSKVGKPFAVASVGAEADALPVAGGPATPYPGRYTAPLLTADGRPVLPPDAPGQYQPGQYPTGQYSPGQPQPGQYPTGYYTPGDTSAPDDGGAARNG